MGKNVQLEFIFENLSEEDVSFSSLLQLEARSGEGDRGELDLPILIAMARYHHLVFLNVKFSLTFLLF